MDMMPTKYFVPEHARSGFASHGGDKGADAFTNRSRYHGSSALHRRVRYTRHDRNLVHRTERGTINLASLGL